MVLRALPLLLNKMLMGRLGESFGRYYFIISRFSGWLTLMNATPRFYPWISLRLLRIRIKSRRTIQAGNSGW